MYMLLIERAVGANERSVTAVAQVNDKHPAVTTAARPPLAVKF